MALDGGIRPLTEFNTDALELVQHLKSTGEPIGLTIDGKVELVVQDAHSYQTLIDQVEVAQTLAGIQRGLEDMRGGRTQPHDVALDEIRRELRLPSAS